jgi:hypothetical protein
MKFSVRFKVLAVPVLMVSAALLVGQFTEASNMGFKMNRTISALGAGSIGTNLVALPYRNPYVNGQDVCVSLGLTAASGRVTRINAATGAKQSHLCGDAPLFNLVPREGLIVTNPTNAGGIVVGSHSSGNASLAALGAGAIGTNLFSVPYHTTAANGQDICIQAGLTAGSGRVTRINAGTGAKQSHLCGDTPLFGLVLGEAVIITDPSAHVFAPAHF